MTSEHKRLSDIGVLPGIDGQIRMDHELKTDPQVFEASFSGNKPWEIRFNDRAFEPGDTVLLRQTLFCGARMADGAPLIYTGRAIVGKITYIHQGPEYGLPPGWCIFSVDKSYHIDEGPVPELTEIERVLSEEAGLEMDTGLVLASDMLVGFIWSHVGQETANATSKALNYLWHSIAAGEGIDQSETEEKQALMLLQGRIDAASLSEEPRNRANQALSQMRGALNALCAIENAPGSDADLASGMRFSGPPPGPAYQWHAFLLRLHQTWQDIQDRDPGNVTAQQEMDEIEGALEAIKAGRASGPLIASSPKRETGEAGNAE